MAGAIGAAVGRSTVERFPDGEARVEVEESVRGHDVYLVQPLSPPADAHLVELLLLADACARAGAARVTAVVPYLAYARQDRRKTGREPVSLRLVADLLRASGIGRVVAVDPHPESFEGFFRTPVEPLTAVPRLAEAVRRDLPPRAVVVAPDLPAAKLADRYARLLGLPVAFVHKERRSGLEVRAVRLTGDVAGLAPVIVDDMIATAGTIEAAAGAAVAAGARADAVTVVATHGLLVGPAVERLRRLGARRIVLSTTVPAPPPGDPPLPLETVDVAPLLAEAVRRLHADESLGDLLLHA
jgi:ribose-phosphate pyrophosphokinase